MISAFGVEHSEISKLSLRRYYHASTATLKAGDKIKPAAAIGFDPQHPPAEAWRGTRVWMGNRKKVARDWVGRDAHVYRVKPSKDVSAHTPNAYDRKAFQDVMFMPKKRRRAEGQYHAGEAEIMATHRGLKRAAAGTVVGGGAAGGTAGVIHHRRKSQ